jgi:hypothetical protein
MQVWDGNKRADGTLVAQTLSGDYVVMPPVGRAIVLCPCCAKPFVTAEAAKRVADALITEK